MNNENESTEESGPVTEADYNELFCNEVGGELEVRHYYSFDTVCCGQSEPVISRPSDTA